MPQSFGTRAERRAFSRDAARHFATTRIRESTPTATGPNRKERRKNGGRHGDVSALVHGPHDRAFLYSGTVNGGGQARINAKRQQRAEYWAEFAKQRDAAQPATVVFASGGVISERDLRDTVERQLRRLGY